MPTPSFHGWLQTRSEEAPAADNLATLIASAGAAGISLDRLRRVVGLSPETLQDMLKALTATGQIVVLKVNGQMVYRVAG
jgi:predicted transcriptional regulator